MARMDYMEMYAARSAETLSCPLSLERAAGLHTLSVSAGICPYRFLVGMHNRVSRANAGGILGSCRPVAGFFSCGELAKSESRSLIFAPTVSISLSHCSSRRGGAERIFFIVSSLVSDHFSCIRLNATDTTSRCLSALPACELALGARRF